MKPRDTDFKHELIDMTPSGPPPDPYGILLWAREARDGTRPQSSVLAKLMFDLAIDVHLWTARGAHHGDIRASAFEDVRQLLRCNWVHTVSGGARLAGLLAAKTEDDGRWILSLFRDCPALGRSRIVMDSTMPKSSKDDWSDRLVCAGLTDKAASVRERSADAARVYKHPWYIPLLREAHRLAKTRPESFGMAIAEIEGGWYVGPPDTTGLCLYYSCQFTGSDRVERGGFVPAFIFEHMSEADVIARIGSSRKVFSSSENLWERWLLQEHCRRHGGNFQYDRSRW